MRLAYLYLDGMALVAGELDIDSMGCGPQYLNLSGDAGP
jgi:hypothetical protein